jgi:hypothetical protein
VGTVHKLRPHVVGASGEFATEVDDVPSRVVSCAELGEQDPLVLANTGA